MIAHHHCSYKLTTKSQNFCRNPFNVTSLCTSSSCPLANSLYATVIEAEGHAYLLIKAAERLHRPKHMWIKIRLQQDYLLARDQINKHLQYYPNLLVLRNKQRLKKIKHFLFGSKALSNKEDEIRTKTSCTSNRLVTIPTKRRRAHERMRFKATATATLEHAIETELLDRLQSGIYGHLFTMPTQLAQQKQNKTEVHTEKLHK